jgi:5'(3')-deoxyribonucleotidase
MYKQKIVIDCDDTLINSGQALRDLHFEKTGELIPEILTWNGSDVLGENYPDDYIESLFLDEGFWRHVKLFPNAKEVLIRLRDSGIYELELCTIGRPKNIKAKIDFLHNNGFDDIFSKYHFIALNNEMVMNKDFLKGLALIDDNVKNLTSEEIDFHILFQGESPKDWNKGWNGLVAHDWLELESMFL